MKGEDSLLPIAKAVKAEELAGAVVVSFDAQWMDIICARKIKSILRKRTPTTSQVQWLYAYVNSPISAVVARTAVKKVSSVSLSAAISKARDLGLSASQIRSYFAKAQHVGLYEINDIEVAKTPLQLDSIRKELIFYPPQSFIFLSKVGKEILDVRAHFRTTDRGTTTE